jgi:hypothetical protein
MATRYLGAPIAPNEDRRLLAGRALFLNDVERLGIAALGHHHGDRLADMANFAAHQR